MSSLLRGSPNAPSILTESSVCWERHRTARLFRLSFTSDVARITAVTSGLKSTGDVVSLRIQSAFCADLSSFLPDGSGELPGDAMLPRGTRRAVLEGLLETPSGALDRTCSRHSS